MENFARFDDMDTADNENITSEENIVLDKFAVVLKQDGIYSIITSGQRFEVEEVYNMLMSLPTNSSVKVYMLNINQLNIELYKDDSRKLSKLLEEAISSM